MAGSVNKAILIGHLGRDPEIRTFQNGGKVANLRLATSETWREKDTGERRERTQWHSVVIFNEGLLKVAEQYLRKGSKVYVEGQIETRKSTGQDGVERYFTEVVLRPFRGEITLLDKLDTGSRGTPEDYNRHDTPRERASADAATSGDAGASGGHADLDDEIPF
ncbi:single-strand DNA-binding protein [Angulomicrobium tetraedrale]|uniref:Single-stranded DNA-binding protein n=1 Tax=Ancylobacter tetraedralis TaxID=217068 RepID=A0A839ZA00_9HYPH|nr:single-stranded DNA-binding protein [Ancylobacter tetraedralis]MBB3771570.1 single-strand DNA-binding protein [Ancylobacter tetraedralis]